MNSIANSNMKTITIEDPAEVKAQLQAEFPQATFVSASYSHFADGSMWLMSVYVREPKLDIQVTGKSAEEALDDIRKKVAAHDPAERLREEAAKLGLKLTPI